MARWSATATTPGMAAWWRFLSAPARKRARSFHLIARTQSRRWWQPREAATGIPLPPEGDERGEGACGHW